MSAPRPNPQPGHPCPAALDSVRSPIRIVEWPCIVLLGACALLLAGLLVAVVVGIFTSPAPATTPVTVQLGETVLECTWYEDRANHVKSLSC